MIDPQSLGTIPPCCDDQKIRVHDATGRPFCASCRRWLDKVVEIEEDDDDTAVEMAGVDEDTPA